MTEKELNTIEFDKEQFDNLGNPDKCYKCPEDPAVVLKQIQEWEYTFKPNETQMVKIFLCEEHHDMMVKKGAEMV